MDLKLKIKVGLILSLFILLIISFFYPNIFPVIFSIILCLILAREISKKKIKSNGDKLKLTVYLVLSFVLFGAFLSYFPSFQTKGEFVVEKDRSDNVAGELFYLLAVEGYDSDHTTNRINESYDLPAGGRYLYNKKQIEQNEFEYNFKLESDLLLSNISIDVFYTDKLGSKEINHYKTYDVPLSYIDTKNVQNFNINVSVIETTLEITLPVEEPTKIIYFQITANINISAYMMSDEEYPEELQNTSFPRYPYYKPSSDNWLEINSVPEDDDYESWGEISGLPAVDIFSMTTYPYPHLIIIASCLVTAFIIAWIVSLISGNTSMLNKLFFIIILVSMVLLLVQIMLWGQDPLYQQLYQLMDNVPKPFVDWATIEVVLKIFGIFIQLFHWAITMGLCIAICFGAIKVNLMINQKMIKGSF